jgi:hypothetical protein
MRNSKVSKRARSLWTSYNPYKAHKMANFFLLTKTSFCSQSAFFAFCHKYFEKRTTKRNLLIAEKAVPVTK